MKNAIDIKEETKCPMMDYLFVPSTGIALLFKDSKQKKNRR